MNPQNNLMPELVKQLHQALFQESSTFDQLSALLSVERKALEQQQIDAVIKFTEKKQLLTKNLEKLAEVRLILLDNLGVSLPEMNSDDAAPNVSATKVPLNSNFELPINIIHLWREVLKKVTVCHEKNSINGKIIKQSHSSVARSLRLLKSQSRDLGLTYTAKGQTHARSSSVNVLKA